MNTHRLRLFVSVADHGGYSRAAEALYISQPAVSAQIQRLEHELGVRLFQKVGREVCLTETGEVLYHYAVRILALCDDAAEAIEQFRQSKRGRIRIGATTTPGVYVLPGLIERLTANNPQLSIEIEIGNHDHIMSRLENFQSDLALVAGVVDPDTFESRPVLDDQLIPVGAVGSPLSKKDRATPEEFAGSRLFLRESGSATRVLVDQAFEKLNVRPKQVTELPSTEAIKQAVASGHGYGVFSRMAIASEVDKGLISIIPVPELHLRRSIMLVVHKEYLASPIVRANLKRVQSELERLAVGGDEGG